MAALVGLSGPQGGGKTTLLNGLKGAGIEVDDFKVSRQVQKELGWSSLTNVMESPETMMAFQVKVRDVKYVRELENRARRDVDIILTERTFADIATYTQLWAWELTEQGKWGVKDAIEFLKDYVGLCRENQEVYEGVLFLPSMPHIKFEEDPHRASEKHIDFVSKQLDAFFDHAQPRMVPVFRISTESIDDRINESYNWIQTL
ncbi:AAA family ATPase [Acinetobacter sp.]|uniref:AAA family ATPase n=1 Tax=Acinetobacter sp. TaxID=472 RepID=UPI00388F6EA4